MLKTYQVTLPGKPG